MSTGWVAATNRGRALRGRTLGAEQAAKLAHAQDWPEARERLRTTMYGADLAPTADRETARLAAASATS